MAIRNKNTLFSLILNNQKKIKSFGVKKIGLFGSFVRGEQNKKSDIDFLVEFDKERKTFDNFINLSFFLEDLIGKKVEVVTVESLSPYIGPHILKEVEYVTFTS